MSELMWAAGLFVGEGSISNRLNLERKRLGGMPLRLKIGMYDEVAIARFVKAVEPHVAEQWGIRCPGLNYSTRQHRRPNGEIVPAYEYSAGNRVAEQICRAIYPHLNTTLKGAQMRLAFERAQLAALEV